MDLFFARAEEEMKGRERQERAERQFTIALKSWIFEMFHTLYSPRFAFPFASI